jgi:hypothetical protein
MRVRHPHFGLGIVVDIETDDADPKVTVRFDAVGQKRPMVRFARLERA